MTKFISKFLISLLLFQGIYCHEVFKEKFLENIHVTELTLKNGMQVYLRPNQSEKQEVLVRLVAKGGYFSFPFSEQPAARLASNIVLESGCGSLSGDQLSALLYNYSIDFEIAVKPLYRTIFAECCPDSLPMLLKLMSDFFSKPQYTQIGLNAALKREGEIIEHSHLDKKQYYENAFFSLNTQSPPKKELLTREALRSIELKKIPELFDKLFANPQSFCCTITGDFEIEFIKPYIAKFLGEIVSKQQNLEFKIPFQPRFPEQSENRFVTLKNGTNSLTRITFPITAALDANNIYKLEMITQTIQAHLRNTMQKRLKSSYGVDVSFEFPFYPSFIFPWITIQFRSDFTQADDLAKIIICEMQNLNSKGPNSNDLQSAEQSQKANNEFWQQDNEYWLSFLTNAYLMNLNPCQVFELQVQRQPVTIRKMKKELSSFVNTSKYTQLTTKPD